MPTIQQPLRRALPMKSLEMERDGYTLFRSRREFDDWSAAHPTVLEGRRAWSRRGFELSAEDAPVEGYCDGCRELRTFDRPDVSETPDFRELLVCPCGLNSRARMVADLTSRFLQHRDEPAPYATEQTSRYFRWLKQRYPSAVGSEYFEDEHRDRLQNYLYELIGADEVLRFEDATRLTLDDDSVDLVATSDVLEHVPDHRRALREFCRVLRPGGHLVLTVPFAWDRSESLRRARLTAKGDVEHLMEPEYHGDPMNDEGVLAFHTFGWDLLEDVRSAGFDDAGWALCWKPVHLLLADLWVLVAQAPEPTDF
jgi:SAM-dependent methyltransferase